MIGASEGWFVVTHSKERGFEYHPIAAWNGREPMIPNGGGVNSPYVQYPEGWTVVGPGDGVKLSDAGAVIRVPRSPVNRF